MDAPNDDLDTQLKPVGRRLPFRCVRVERRRRRQNTAAKLDGQPGGERAKPLPLWRALAKIASMTVYTDQERDTIRTAAFGAMTLVSAADPGFLSMFKESMAG